jgi:hypothetical protein
MAGYGPAIRGGSVQGFPCRYQERRVLDEHFKGRKANAWRAANGIPWVAEASQAERAE